MFSLKILLVFKQYNICNSDSERHSGWGFPIKENEVATQRVIVLGSIAPSLQCVPGSFSLSPRITLQDRHCYSSQTKNEILGGK